MAPLQPFSGILNLVMEYMVVENRESGVEGGKVGGNGAE